MTNISDPVKGFQLTVKSLYDIENQLIAALPKMAEAATNAELADGFETHLSETEGHCERLEEIFDLMDMQPQKHTSEAIRGLIADGRAIIATEMPASLKDAMLASGGRKVEHFEIASYMSAIEEAKALELPDVVNLLKANLSEEEAADKKLEAAVKDSLMVVK